MSEDVPAHYEPHDAVMTTGLLSRTASSPAEPAFESQPDRPGPTWWWWAGLSACLALATMLRVWGAPANSGVGNSYYAAAAVSMSRDWAAFFTGALDTELFMSIDKPAAWLWPSAL